MTKRSTTQTGRTRIKLHASTRIAMESATEEALETTESLLTAEQTAEDTSIAITIPALPPLLWDAPWPTVRLSRQERIAVTQGYVLATHLGIDPAAFVAPSREPIAFDGPSPVNHAQRSVVFLALAVAKDESEDSVALRTPRDRRSDTMSAAHRPAAVAGQLVYEPEEESTAVVLSSVKPRVVAAITPTTKSAKSAGAVVYQPESQTAIAPIRHPAPVAIHTRPSQSTPKPVPTILLANLALVGAAFTLLSIFLTNWLGGLSIYVAMGGVISGIAALQPEHIRKRDREKAVVGIALTVLLTLLHIAINMVMSAAQHPY